LSQATDTQSAQQGAVTQAQNLRQQESGVSLDAQAVQLVQFQQAYSANSRFVSVIDTITSDIIQMMGAAG
jgi:flagellar hook-associated protein 1 FlgK